MSYAKFKICVFGDGGVGKTTLVNRYLTGLFKEGYHITIGADFFLKKIVYDDKEITLQIWDFAGEERFRFLLPRYVQGSSGAIFMFDITRSSSILNFSEWIDVFKESFDRNLVDIPILLVGGKLDLEHKREITPTDAMGIAQKNRFKDYMECSAKTGENVEKIFEIITGLMIEKLEQL